MKKILTYSLLILLYTSCVNSKEQKDTNKPVVKNDWQLVWWDEFDINGLPDSTKWSYATKGNEYGWGNNEAQWYTVADTDNCFIEDGILKITAKKEKISSKNYSSVRLTTKDKSSWRYCKVEARAKLPTGNGTWPAIWMMPAKNSYGGWPKSGEIDIMEHVGFNPDTVFSTVHTEKFNHMIGTQVGKKTKLPEATTNFNIYTMEWDEGEIRSYVNSKHFFTFKNNGEGYEAWPFDQAFHLILNLAIGGGLGGQKGIDDSLFPHTFEVDYIRVYQRKESQ
ncbi:family 16 glycosylhydrolase [Maribellus comscasis]|uniref:Family 16 glycosylhydrolase n=1 Tax=Maribellus comscasis TaxID=2681766 RepID=A0A6I6JRG1_9BACT|nr:glycoside hydrolase family 16 protein [Maribellus comscasis]QGY45605.1 family 16 glycosylhydrolase [Maribellus comscasis]